MPGDSSIFTTETDPQLPSYLDPAYFEQAADFTRFGEIAFFPLHSYQQDMPIEFRSKGNLTDQTWFQNQAKRLRIDLSKTLDTRTTRFIVDSAHWNHFNDEYRVGDTEETSEPEWMAQLDPATQAQLRRQQGGTLSSNREMITGSQRFREIFGFAYLIEHDPKNGFLKPLADNLWLWRLRRIQQLAWLKVPANSIDARVQFEFPHNRYAHSCTVLVIASLIGHNLGLSKEELEDLQIAAFTHDVLTPAGGDRTKAMDPVFDEDEHYLDAYSLYPGRPYPTLSTRADWNELEKRLLPTGRKERIAKIVQGQGLLGKILDIADKIAYVGDDASNYLSTTILPRSCTDDPDFKQIESKVNQAIKEHSFACAPWMDLAREGDQVYFKSADRLANFLDIRALMFKNVYYNPAARSPEHALASIAGQALYQSGNLTREKLLTITDDELRMELRKFLWGDAYDRGFETMFDSRFAQVISCESAQETQQKLNELSAGNLVLVERFYGTTGTGEKLLVKERGQIMPFSEARPAATKKIQEIFQSRAGYVIYVLPLEGLNLKPEAEALIRQTQLNQKLS